MNRKNLFLPVLVSMVLLTGPANAQEEEQMLQKLYKSKFVTEKQLIVSNDLSKVFSGTFYTVNAGFKYPDLQSTEFCVVNTAVVLGNKAEILDLTGKNLLPYVKKDFTLSTEENAKAFEAALDLLFPIIMDEGVKGHKKINGKWYFIRGTYFEDKRAFVVSVDGSSRITGIIYDEHAIKGS